MGCGNSSVNPVNHKLTYFNGRGRAETIRLCLAASGIKYEDVRVEKEDWPAMKPNTPWNSLPLLELDGKHVGQSMAIARFVAREGGLYGKDSIEQGLIDSVVDTVTELREKAVTLAFTPDGAAKQQALKEFTDKTLPSILPNLEKFAANNKSGVGFFVGEKISLADIHFYSVSEQMMVKMPDVLNSYPTLNKLFDKVAANPKIAAYIKSRPETPF